MNSDGDIAKTRDPAPGSASGSAGNVAVGKSPLDDVMIAMDVVDTLRHDRNLVERELNDSARRQDLIERLREIYRGQGIEVPDHILEEGVKALEEDRFTYKPPNEDALSTKLARLYVTRLSWSRYVVGGVLAIVAFFAFNYVVYERPKQLQAQAEQQAISELPARVKALAANIASEARDPLVGEKADALAKSGANAAAAGNLAAARKAEAELNETLEKLRAAYQIRIVNRPGEVSGLWRIPDANPDTYNFYLVVEAIGPDGKVVPQTITNEETGNTERVATWAVRVDRSVLTAVKADKDDDGIIQNNIVGRKERGRLEADWTIAKTGGAITRWK